MTKELSKNDALDAVDRWREWVEDAVSGPEDEQGKRLANFLMVMRDFIDQRSTKWPARGQTWTDIGSHALQLVANAEDPSQNFYDCTVTIDADRHDA